MLANDLFKSFMTNISNSCFPFMVAPKNKYIKEIKNKELNASLSEGKPFLQLCK